MIKNTFDSGIVPLENMHEYFMREALKQALIAYDRGEVPVGAVVVYKNKIIARGHNQMETLHDPTAHAEMIAITSASEKLSEQSDKHRGSLEGCTLYVTMECCPMCAGALVITKCSAVVYGAADAKAGACETLFKIPQDDRLNHRLSVLGGVMEEDSKLLLREFFINLRNKAKSR